MSMQNQKEGADCYSTECPYKKPHRHIQTNNGEYIKYIIENPRKPYFDTDG